MVSHQCGFFHESLNDQTAGISCHILSSWMVPHQCGSFMSLQMIRPTDLSATKQLNGFSTVWILSFIFKFPGSLKFLSHFEHLNGFSPAWILTWQSNLPFVVNALLHSELLSSLLKVVHWSPLFKLNWLLMVSSPWNALWAASGSIANLQLMALETN